MVVAGGRGANGNDGGWFWKMISSWRWKRLVLLRRLSFLEDVVFRVLYCLEAVVLVGGICFFYLFCGCHL
ncbi:hypothetical protein Cni_G29421 [Canna indica]|uniref:Transmembrane protein n=1 Tax=Canna indica TaxID=4628 RepID=A0AAQ3QPK2_9LILI|nr:hypothetical protein Cni_G29421 [Canna indica]